MQTEELIKILESELANINDKGMYVNVDLVFKLGLLKSLTDIKIELAEINIRSERK